MTDRITCTRCRHYTGTHCTRPKQAGLHAHFGKAEIGPVLASLPQRCPAGVMK
jgi:hypothetical protein